MGVSDNTVGLSLAVASSAFIGASFILKKIGLIRAGKGGVRAGHLSLCFAASFSGQPLFASWDWSPPSSIGRTASRLV
jgi:hypothetical protein